jgi:hypothetical protein
MTVFLGQPPRPDWLLSFTAAARPFERDPSALRTNCVLRSHYRLAAVLVGIRCRGRARCIRSQCAAKK